MNDLVVLNGKDKEAGTGGIAVTSGILGMIGGVIFTSAMRSRALNRNIDLRVTNDSEYDRLLRYTKAERGGNTSGTETFTDEKSIRDNALSKQASFVSDAKTSFGFLVAGALLPLISYGIDGERRSLASENESLQLKSNRMRKLNNRNDRKRIV